MATTINDFGEKIGGARKDIWSRGLMLDDVLSMNDRERDKYCAKQYVWPVPKWTQLLKEGVASQAILFWQNEMRKAFPATPVASKEAQDRYVDFCSKYRAAVMAVKDKTGAQTFLETFLVGEGYIKKAVNNFGYCCRYEMQEKAAHCVTNKMLRLASLSDSDFSRLEREAKLKLFAIDASEKVVHQVRNQLQVLFYDDKSVKVKDEDRGDGICVEICTAYGKSFLYDRKTDKRASDYTVGTYFIMDISSRHIVAGNFISKDEATAYVENVAKLAQANKSETDSKSKNENKTTGRKKAFPLEKLDHLERTGPEWLRAHHAGENEFLHTLGFRACEFGNWLNTDSERQKHLDLAYASLQDLAMLLGIDSHDLSLDGVLALAFGSRGRGGMGAASAHYESMRQVINLTRFNGAGCLAHEWAHALDDYLGRYFKIKGTYLSENVFSWRNHEIEKRVPAAFPEIIRLMLEKEVMISEEEAKEEKERHIRISKKMIQNWTDNNFPYSASESEMAEWDGLVEEMIGSVDSLPETTVYADHSKNVYPPIEKLSTMKQEIDRHGEFRLAQKQALESLLRNYKKDKDTPVSEYRKHRIEDTDFLAGSRKFDNMFSKAGEGYWSSTVEMFARAFDCYVEDKLKSAHMRSDYLSSHASAYSVYVEEKDGKREKVYAIPQGAERKALNKKFDELIKQLKDMGVFHITDSKPVFTPSSSGIAAGKPVPATKPKRTKRTHTQEETVQLTFEDLLSVAK